MKGDVQLLNRICLYYYNFAYIPISQRKMSKLLSLPNVYVITTYFENYI